MIPTWRKVLYAAVVTVVVLGTANLLIAQLERGEVIDTLRPDDVVHHIDDALITLNDGSWRTTAYAERGMLPLEIDAERVPERLRILLTGGSFAMGTPYSHQRHGEERPGGMAAWLRAELTARDPHHPPEVLNLAAGGQSSTRVVRILEQTAPLQPDVVIVASCNNEGSMTPNAIEEGLRTLAGVRFLSKLLRPGPDDETRPLYAPQDADWQSLQAIFERNLARVVQLTREQGAELLLCTLPINLRYQGWIPGTLRAPKEGGGLRPVARECKAGDCAHDTTEPCIDQAQALWDAGEVDAAQSLLDGCDDLEGLRMLGLMEYERGEYASARRLLEQYTDLVPRGRCRPSLAQLIREQAAESSDTTLVDLDAHARSLSPDGIADPALFVDNCHMSWVGYRLMTDALLHALERRGLVPAATTDGVDRYEHATGLGLPPVERMDLIGGPALSTEALPDSRDPWGERGQRRPPRGGPAR